MFTNWKQRVWHYLAEKRRFCMAEKRSIPIYDIYYFNGTQQWLYVLTGAIFTIFFAIFFYRSFWAVLPLSPIGVYFYHMGEVNKGKKRKQQLEREFKDCILTVSANLRAGYAVENAFVESIADMKTLYGEVGFIYKELLRFKKSMGNNQSLEQLLTELGQRSGSTNIQEFAEVFSIGVQNGGNLPEIIQEAADMISKNISLKQEMLVMISGRLFEQRIMGIIPFLLVCYIEIGNRGFFDVLYHNLTGVCVMTVCLAVYLVAQAVSQKICQPIR